MSRILHAALPAEWAAARTTGRYDGSTRGRRLADEGFIHASTSAQLPVVLGAFYADLDELVLLVLDVPALEAAGSMVRWEQVPDAAAPFPHIYGPVPVGAPVVAPVAPDVAPVDAASPVGAQPNPVIAALPLRRPSGAVWSLPDLSGYDLATGPDARRT